MRRPPREWVRQTWEAVQFRRRPPDWDAVLTDDLTFGDEGVAAFQQLLAEAANYLEFGAGASTFAAARAGVPLVTVESDAAFLMTVASKCKSVAEGKESSPMTFLHANIGATGPWGKPVIPSIQRPRRWSSYPGAPWKQLGADYRADAILIDGRFRVACALSVALHQPDIEWTILLDDYQGRGHYKAVEDFARLVELQGRMARFVPRPQVNRHSLAAALRHYTSDWR